MHIESEASQFFACYITQLKVKESFKLSLALKEHQTKMKKKNLDSLIVAFIPPLQRFDTLKTHSV